MRCIHGYKMARHYSDIRDCPLFVLYHATVRYRGVAFVFATLGPVRHSGAAGGWTRRALVKSTSSHRRQRSAQTHAAGEWSM